MSALISSVFSSPHGNSAEESIEFMWQNQMSNVQNECGAESIVWAGGAFFQMDSKSLAEKQFKYNENDTYENVPMHSIIGFIEYCVY